jgi:hypothetical protein
MRCERFHSAQTQTSPNFNPEILSPTRVSRDQKEYGEASDGGRNSPKRMTWNDGPGHP